MTNNQIHYWRVRAVNTNGQHAAWSSVYSLQVSWGTISGISPTDDGSTTDTTPTLSWDSVDGAAGYELRYTTTAGGSDIASVTVHTVTAPTTEYQYPSSLNVGDTLFWQVRTKDGDDQYGAWSAVSDFLIIIVEMVSVDGGTFILGSEVTLSDFTIGKYEVTFAEWEEVYAWALSHGYSFDNAGQAGDDGTPSDTFDEPVTSINWRDAMVWCNAASEYEGLTPVYTYSSVVIKDSNATTCDNAGCDWNENGYRLPTEAEWQFAARGGNNSSGYTYSGSNSINGVAWYTENSDSDTKTVGTKAANELGLYDMSGNVWEWCWDWSGDYNYTPVTNPTGPSSGSSRILRGGCWLNTEDRCRVYSRGAYGPGDGDSRFGLRPARSR